MSATFDLFDNSQAAETIPLVDAGLRLWRAFYLPHQAQQYMDVLLKEIDWRQENIVLWGKQYPQPRLTAWYGDPGSNYAYSGIALQPQAWTPTLLQLKNDIEQACGHRFNSVLLNLYRNEEDSVGWHSDAEVELGPTPAIASLSLGATRRFRLRHKSIKDIKPLSIDLHNGSLLLMSGATQQFWQHAVPKEKHTCGARINLTFRKILMPD